MDRGFILHPTYFVENGRPVVHLFGRLDTGETFVVRDNRTRPEFFMRRSELPAALRIVSLHSGDSSFRTIDGDQACRIQTRIPADVPPLRDRLEAGGIRTFEADIPFVTRFLMDAGIRGSLEIEGEFRPGRRVGRIYTNPVLRPVEWIPEPATICLDIETDPEAKRVYSVSLCGEAVREVLVWLPDPPPEGWNPGEVRELHDWPTAPEDANTADLAVAAASAPEKNAGGPACPVVRTFADERSLLQGLALRLGEIDPDVLSGWNVIDFDLRVLQARFDAHRLPFHLGRAEIPGRLQIDRSAWGASRAILPGRVVLDGLALVRGAFIRLEDYRLQTAAAEILGRGKSIDAEDRAEEIQRLYREDLPAFLVYNLNDSMLVHEILREKGLVELAVRQSLLTGMPMDRTGASIASFDFLYLSELHRRGFVAPTVDSSRPTRTTTGGFVLPAEPGFYENVAVLDYRSLYPAIIRTFRLDPLSLVREGEDPGELPIRAPNGALFRRRGGILPEILDRLFPLRQAALDARDKLRATALKILMNSFYGVLGTPYCRFYSPDTANAITGFGREILLWTKEEIESVGHRVLYGDTDSIFVETGALTSEDAMAIGGALGERINGSLARRLRAEHTVESRLHLQFEHLFRRLMLPSLRGSAEGSKKRYAGILGEGTDQRIHFVGLESVRRDWTDLSKRFQQELLALAFDRKPVDAYVSGFLERFRTGEMDDLVVYRKALRKQEDEYHGTPPPHVQAARKLSRPAGRIMRYVITTDGPEPADDQRHPLDREHYVEKQLRPVGEAILSLLGLSWEDVAGGQGTLPL